MRTHWRIPLLLTAFIALTSVNWPIGQAIAIKAPDSAVKGKGALITPVLDAPIIGGTSLLWCGTFQLAWNEACNRFKHPIELVPASRLTGVLNRREFDRKSVDEASIFVASGALEEGIIQKIKAGIREKNAPDSRLLDGLQPMRDDLVCYARLDKALSFPKPFGRLESFPLAGRKVPCFGFLKNNPDAEDLRREVLIHHYSDAQDFVIQLQTTDPEDMLILAKTPPSATLGETVSKVAARLVGSPSQAHGRDVLVAPCVSFAEATSFSELEGRQVAGAPQWRLSRAIQSIDFRMDEKGVTLHSESEVTFGCSAQEPPEHLMILNPPFLLLMKRRSAKAPYLACWIANADLLARR